MNNSNSKFEIVIMVNKNIDFRKLFYQQSLEFGIIEGVYSLYDEDNETDAETKESYDLLISALPSGCCEILFL